MSNEFRQVDLMIGDVRRRRWTTERKLQIIEESYAAGETVSSAARRHGFSPVTFSAQRPLFRPVSCYAFFK